jgi:hypothetical protein
MSSVLIYNAIKQNFAYNRSASTAAITTIAQSAGTAAGIAAGGGPSTCLTAANVGNQIGFSPSTSIETWKTIPRLAGYTGSIAVCDTSGYFRCGASCTWTVPTGVTCADFQLWGPGSGTGTNCCCGGAPHGPTGAFASVVMPVTAGSVYTICAGCAYCCYASQTTPGLCGGPSYVTGPGLNNFCADSGISCVCNWRASLPGPASGTLGWGLTYPGGSGCQFPSGNNCGPESCSGWNFCWDSLNDSVTIQDFSFSCVTRFYGTATGSCVYGLAGMYPKFMISETMCGISVAAPVYGFENSTQCIYCWNGNTCAGCMAAPMCGSGFLRNPGSGGYASSVYGGCNACYGDSGRMGMVCVRFK